MVVKCLLLLLQCQVISALLHHIKTSNYITFVPFHRRIFGFLQAAISQKYIFFPPGKVLNEYFHNVCELDLVFNFYKVRGVERFFSPSEIFKLPRRKTLIRQKVKEKEGRQKADRKMFLSLEYHGN